MIYTEMNNWNKRPGSHILVMNNLITAILELLLIIKVYVCRRHNFAIPKGKGDLILQYFNSYHVKLKITIETENHHLGF